jgi:hypothetical protein
MEDYSDSDTSSESEYESDRESAPGSDCDTGVSRGSPIPQYDRTAPYYQQQAVSSSSHPI